MLARLNSNHLTPFTLTEPELLPARNISPSLLLNLDGILRPRYNRARGLAEGKQGRIWPMLSLRVTPPDGFEPSIGCLEGCG